MDNVYDAFVRLKESGLEPTLVNARFVKPVDMELVKSLAGYEHVFVIEENISSGGYAAALLECAAREGLECGRIRSISLPCAFIPQGSRNELLSLYGLDSDGIYKTIMLECKPEAYSES
jgi:1-deoxy-D-xylulose-5-phosphate synthase